MKSRVFTAPLVVIALISVKAGVSAALTSTGQNATNSNDVQYCNRSTHTSHMWGDVNPNIFYMCDEASNTTLKLQCPMGHGFFSGRGYYGCIPYDEWPACIDNNGSSNGSSSSEHGNGTALICREEQHLQQTWAAVDPNKFYICQQADTEPQLLSCESGKGYISVWVGSGTGGGHRETHIVGCATWEKWRMYMNCEGFY